LAQLALLTIDAYGKVWLSPLFWLYYLLSAWRPFPGSLKFSINRKDEIVFHVGLGIVTCLVQEGLLLRYEGIIEAGSGYVTFPLLLVGLIAGLFIGGFGVLFFSQNLFSFLAMDDDDYDDISD
jgi:hypothetical protein